MNPKIISQLDAEGYFVCPTVADESPLERGVFLMPAKSVDFPPPVVPAGQRARFDGKKFVLENIPVPEPDPAPIPPTDEEVAATVRNARQAAYRIESDPLFFKSQRGEVSSDTWLAKVEEIKSRYPDGAMPT